MKWAGLLVVTLWTAVSLAQEVKVTPGKNGVNISISAQQAYNILASENIRPALSLQCSVKGKKPLHLLVFTAGGMLAETDPENSPKSGEFSLIMTINGTKQATSWIAYNDPATFAYYGKTEPQRVDFLRTMLASPTITVEFTPFVTGTPATAVFDIAKFRDEVNRHPECALN